jgi:hypothetical protein
MEPAGTGAGVTGAGVTGAGVTGAAVTGAGVTRVTGSGIKGTADTAVPISACVASGMTGTAVDDAAGAFFDSNFFSLPPLVLEERCVVLFVAEIAQKTM